MNRSLLRGFRYDLHGLATNCTAPTGRLKKRDLKFYGDRMNVHKAKRDPIILSCIFAQSSWSFVVPCVTEDFIARAFQQDLTLSPPLPPSPDKECRAESQRNIRAPKESAPRRGATSRPMVP